MSLAKGFAGSAVGAVVGGVAWVGLSAASGWGLGLMGIVLGGLAGYGMARGNDGRGGVHAGVAAAAVTMLAVLVCRFVVIQVMVQGSMAEEARITDEDAVRSLASAEFERMRAGGDEFEEWDQYEDEWPPIVQYRAELAWSQMSEFDREAMIGELEAEWREENAAAAPLVGIGWFVYSTLHPMGLVFLGLAMSTAYKTASMDMRAEAAARGVSLDAPAASDGASAVRGGGIAMGDDERPSGGIFSMPIPREEVDDGLPTFEDIRRKHAAAEAEAKGDAETEAA